MEMHNLKFLVIGDIMLDKYVIGNVERISPEAPVPVVDVKKEYCTLGGCGNVAKNLANLTTRTVCIAACGVGQEREKLMAIMAKKHIKANLVNCRDRVTTIKERIISGDRSTQLLRIDRETTEPVEAARIITEINHVIRTQMFVPDVILISDYCKGVITEDLMLYIEELAMKMDIKLIVDPKPKHQKMYNRAFAITPNHKEYQLMYDNGILKNIDLKNIIVTEGSDGVFVARTENSVPVQIPAEAVEVFNVTGAGDSFVAVFSVCVAMGIDVVQASRIANKCAAYVVTKPGTASVPWTVFKNSVRSIFTKGEYI